MRPYGGRTNEMALCGTVGSEKERGILMTDNTANEVVTADSDRLFYTTSPFARNSLLYLQAMDGGRPYRRIRLTRGICSPGLSSLSGRDREASSIAERNML